MIYEILQFIFSLAIVIFSITIFVKGYNDSESDLEKALYIIMSVACMFPLLIYYLDRYNIPTKLGYTENIVSRDWVNIITTYSTSIISTLLSAIFLIFITFKQLRETSNDNIRLNNETQRMQNLPYLQYDFTNEIIDKNLCSDKIKLITINDNNNDNDSIDFTIKIKNIGLNTARKVIFELKSDLFEKEEYSELQNQGMLEKNETKEKEVIILNVAKGTHRIEIIVYYQDLLKNWYSQKIYLVISVTNIYDSKTGNCDHIDSFIVNDEEKMINEPSIIKMLNKDLIK